MNYISVNNISFSYNKKNVFDNFSMQFPAGKTSVIMSPSGGGKTTLLFMIAGLTTPSDGTITYPVINPRFSFVFQEDRLIDSLSVIGNIKLVKNKPADSYISECLTALGLDNLINKKVHRLSGGEKRRVAIARALLADYDILLLDEPFTGIDDTRKNIIIEYIKSSTAGKTVLLVTHDKTEATLCGDAVFNLK